MDEYTRIAKPILRGFAVKGFHAMPYYFFDKTGYTDMHFVLRLVNRTFNSRRNLPAQWS
jgi:hypothetical protein